MKIGFEVKNFTPPPRPKDLSLSGTQVDLVPLRADLFGKDLYDSYALDTAGINWTYLVYGPYPNLEAYLDWVRSVEGGDDPCFFAVIPKNHNKAAGIASYLRINPEAGSIEVGHLHFSPILQGTNASTEAMFLMMQWAFDNGYRRYEWKCNALNQRSRKAAQRLGFSYEGVFRQALVSKGRNRDTAWFAIIDQEWPALKNCFKQFLSPDNFGENGQPRVALSALTRPLLYKEDSFEGT